MSTSSRDHEVRRGRLGLRHPPRDRALQPGQLLGSVTSPRPPSPSRGAAGAAAPPRAPPSGGPRSSAGGWSAPVPRAAASTSALTIRPPGPGALARPPARPHLARHPPRDRRGLHPPVAAARRRRPRRRRRRPRASPSLRRPRRSLGGLRVGPPSSLSVVRSFGLRRPRSSSSAGLVVCVLLAWPAGLVVVLRRPRRFGLGVVVRVFARRPRPSASVVVLVVLGLVAFGVFVLVLAVLAPSPPRRPAAAALTEPRDRLADRERVPLLRRRSRASPSSSAS